MVGPRGAAEPFRRFGWSRRAAWPRSHYRRPGRESLHGHEAHEERAHLTGPLVGFRRYVAVISDGGALFQPAQQCRTSRWPLAPGRCSH